MKTIHWFSLAAVILGLVLLFAGLATAGAVVLAGTTVVELIHSAWTGKQTNDGIR